MQLYRRSFINYIKETVQFRILRRGIDNVRYFYTDNIPMSMGFINSGGPVAYPRDNGRELL